MRTGCGIGRLGLSGQRPALPVLFWHRAHVGRLAILLQFEQADRRQQIAELAVAIVARIERGLVADLAADRAEVRPAILTLGRGHRTAQHLHQPGVTAHFRTALAWPGIVVGHRLVRGLLAGRLFGIRHAGMGLAQCLQVGELRARIDEWLGRLLLAEAIYLHAIGQQAHHHRGEVRIAGDDGEAIKVARVQQVHGIDHHRHVRSVLALAVSELLDRADRILMQHRFPPLQSRALPVAVGTAHVGHAVAGDFRQDLVDLRGRRIVGVDQQGDALFRFAHGLLTGRCLNPSIADPGRR